MILIENSWSEDLERLKYGSGYDIRIHAVQVAINLVSRRSTVTGASMDNIDYSSVNFGYFCPETESSIKAFQLAAGIPVTEKLDELTFRYIFMTVRKELNAVIAKTSENTLKIYEITKEVLELLPEEVINMNYGHPAFEDENTWTDEDFANGIGEYTDAFIAEINPDSWETMYSDSFWDSLFKEEDDYFAMYSDAGSLFGNGGSLLNNGVYMNGGYGDDSYINGAWVLSGFKTGTTATTMSSNNPDGVTFVDGLLANSIYKGNFDYSRPVSWTSKSKMSININGYKYEDSLKYKTFFNDMNLSDTRKSGYDITIVYGPNGRFAKKILDVRPRGKSQQIDASGEAIFEVIDFIAKDVVETDNVRLEFA